MHKRNMKQIITLAIVALILTGIVLGVWVANIRSEKAARTRAQEVLRDSSFEQVTTLSAALDGQICALKLMSGTIDLHTQNELDELMTIAANELNCGEVFIVDKSGTSLSGLSKGTNMSYRNYISEALNGKTGMEAILTDILMLPSIALAVPYYENGEISGALCGLYFADNLSDLLYNNSDEGASYSYIVNSKGDIIIGAGNKGQTVTGMNIEAISDDLKLTGENKHIFTDFISMLSTRKEASMSFKAGSVARFVVAIPIENKLLPENDWFVINVATEKQLAPQMESARDDAVSSMLVFILFSLAALALFIFLRHSYEKQIKLDNDAMQSLLSDIPGGYVRLKLLSNNMAIPVYVNQSAYAQARMSKNELIELYKQDMSERVHPDDLARVKKVFAEATKAGSFRGDRYRLITGDGDYRWFSVNGNVSKNDNGTFINLFYTDANEQEEARLRYANALTKLDTELTNEVGRCFLNISKNIADENSSIFPDADLLNFDGSMDSVIAQIADWLPVKEERLKYLSTFSRKALIDAFISGTEYVDLEHRVDLGDELIWIRTSASMIKNPHTGDLEAALYAQNTNNEHQMRQLLNLVVDAAYDFIIVVNIKSGKYKAYRKSSSITTSFQEEGEYEHSVVGLLEYIYPDDRKDTINSVRIPNIIERLNVEGLVEISYRISEDLSVRDKLLTCQWVDESKQDILFCRRDVTELLEKENLQREQMAEALDIAEQANCAKTDFLSSMSHDIRTPMNAIVGMTEIALADMSNTAQVFESLNIIKTSSAHLLSLINDILDMSRIESGKMVLTDEPFSHSELFKKCIVIYEATAEPKGISFITSINITNDRCYGDAQRITRIADNLMGNAIKFTPQGGTIKVCLNELMSDMPGIALYEFVVSDNGTGMSKETLRHIFEPFYRAESSKAAHIQGTGLGLSIVKSIVDLIGGTIDVSSELGVGTAFSVRMPLRIAKPADDEPERIATLFNERDLGGVSVLLCEDNYVNQLVATRLLERMGANVCIAENGQQGYDLFVGNPPGTYDAILMDVQMPVMNGYETTIAIRASKHEDAKTIPIIAMTANAFVEDVHKSLSAGMDAHLSKPIEPDKLYEALAYLRKHE